MKISIITPNYNYSEFISETIQNVISQNYQNWEHIIVDDGSTDRSVEVINLYVDKFPEKIILICQHNRGQTIAINNAFKHATGDILGWINSDDYYCENIFSKVVSIFKKEPQTDIVFGNVNIVDISGNFIYMKRHFKFNYIESTFLGFGNTLTSNCIFWRKSLSDKVGFFDERLKCNMDGEYLSRLTYKAKLHFLDKPLANFRRQQVTLAGKDNSEWGKIVKNEIRYEKERSYKRLLISNILPFSLGKHIVFYYLFLRFFKRILRLDYYFNYMNKNIYLRNLK